MSTNLKQLPTRYYVRDQATGPYERGIIIYSNTGHRREGKQK
jgi:hypothetical protein